MDVGFHYGVSFEDYLAIPAANKSGLEAFNRSPLHFWHDNLRQDRAPNESSPAQRLGTGIHTRILERDAFYARYAVIPKDAPKRPTIVQLEAKKPSEKTIQQIEWWTAFDDASAGKEQITAAQYDTICTIGTMVRTHPTTSVLLEEGKAEVTMIWLDPITRIKCKGRVDWLHLAANGFVLDLKSCQDASPRAFGKDAWNYDYHVQYAFYHDGIEALTGFQLPFYFQAIEKEGPYATAVYEGTSEHLRIGRMVYRRQLMNYAECLSKQLWPSYPEEITPLWMPDWAKKEGEREQHTASPIEY